ncbi:MAG: response regulator [Gemmatimonadetes bacterium]|nr:MAG: response regulator [Gemmatimonadota bacterium]
MPKKKILIADDEEHIRELLKLLLEDDGYDVVTAADGEEAVKTAVEETPDAIILDIMMPKMDGYQAFHSIREHEETRDIPVLVLTAKSEPIYDRISKGIGADGHIIKPFDADEVLERIRNLIGE